MTAFAAILRRELTSRSALFAVSLVMGGMAAIVPWLSPRSTAPHELRGAAALVLALVWTTLLSLGLGATVLARDAADRRLGFDFSLPASATSIWAGRLLGAWLTILLAGAMTLALPALAGFDLRSASAGLDHLFYEIANPRGGAIQPENLFVWAPLLYLALLLLSNVAGLAFFGQRGWIALDLVALGALASAAIWTWHSLRLWNATPTAKVVLAFLAVGAVVSLLGATWRQLARGRTEMDRAQLAHSTSFAAGVGFAVAAASLFALWYLRPSPWALESGTAYVRALGERWAVVEGLAEGRLPSFRFLVDLLEQRTLRLGPGDPALSRWSFAAQASDDERTLAWLETGPRESDGSSLHLLKVDSSGRLRRGGSIDWNGKPIAWALSPQGDRVAVRWPRGLESRIVAAGLRIVVNDLDERQGSMTYDAPDCRSSGPVRFASARVVEATCSDPVYFSIEYSHERPRRASGSAWGWCGTGLPQPSDGVVLHLEAGSMSRFHRVPWPSQDLFYDGFGVIEIAGRGARLRPRYEPIGSRRLAGFDRLEPNEDTLLATMSLPEKASGGRLADGLLLPDGRTVLIVEREPTPLDAAHGRARGEEATSGSPASLLLRFDAAGAPSEVVALPAGVFRVLDYERATSSLLLLGDRERWSRRGAPAPFSVRFDLDRADLSAVEPFTMPEFPDWLVARPQVAPDGEWRWREADSGPERRLLGPDPRFLRWVPSILSSARPSSSLID